MHIYPGIEDNMKQHYNEAKLYFKNYINIAYLHSH
jgi:hypothetical protein